MPPRFMRRAATSPCEGLGARISRQSFFAAHGLDFADAAGSLSLASVEPPSLFDEADPLSDPAGVVARVDPSSRSASSSSSASVSPSENASIAGNSSPSSSAHLPTDPSDRRGGLAAARGLGMLGGLPEFACCFGSTCCFGSACCAATSPDRDPLETRAAAGAGDLDRPLRPLPPPEPFAAFLTFFARNAAVALFSGLPPSPPPPARLPPLDTLGVARAGDLPLSRLFLFLLELFLFLFVESPACCPAVFFA